MPRLALCPQESVPVPAEGSEHVEHDALAAVVQADGGEQLTAAGRCSVELLLPEGDGETDAVLREKQLALPRQPAAPNHIARAEGLAVLQPGGRGCAVLAACAVEREGAGKHAELRHRRHDGASDADRNGAARRRQYQTMERAWGEIALAAVEQMIGCQRWPEQGTF
jgi:hypothetical protein